MAPLSHMERSLLETSGKSHPTSGQHGIGKAAGLSFPLVPPAPAPGHSSFLAQDVPQHMNLAAEDKASPWCWDNLHAVLSSPAQPHPASTRAGSMF